MSPTQQIIAAIHGLEASLTSVKRSITITEKRCRGHIARDRHVLILRELRAVQTQLEDMVRNCRYQLQHLPEAHPS